MQFDKNEINAEIKRSDAKSVRAYDTSKILKNYLALLNKMNNNLETMCIHELGLFSKSMHRWLTKKDLINVPEDSPIAIGDICMIDWSVNYKPELSYYHPAVILEKINNMYLVVPTSSKPNAIPKAYHPVDNPNGKWYWRKVEVSDGFSEECILLMDNIKVISQTRIMKKMGKLACSLTDENGLYREIRRNIIKNAFRGEYKKYESLLEHSKKLEEENAVFAQKMKELEDRNTFLEQKVAELEKSVFQNMQENS